MLTKGFNYYSVPLCFQFSFFQKVNDSIYFRRRPLWPFGGGQPTLARTSKSTNKNAKLTKNWKPNTFFSPFWEAEKEHEQTGNWIIKNSATRRQFKFEDKIGIFTTTMLLLQGVRETKARVQTPPVMKAITFASKAVASMPASAAPMSRSGAITSAGAWRG